MIFTKKYNFDEKTKTFEMIENKKIYKSFYEMVKNESEEKLHFFRTESTGTENYHHLQNATFLYTDAFSFFMKENECFWLADVINSYMSFSKIYTTVSKTGAITWNENPNGADDFLILYLQKTGENKAVFTIECETWNNEKDDFETKSIVYQEIPFTDIKIDSLKLFLENGVVLFPEEH